MFNSISKESSKYYYLKKVGILIFLISFSIALWYALLNAQTCSLCLIIRNPMSGRILYTKHIKPGDTFVYTYIHSLEKLPVHETFMVGENLDIILTGTMLKSLSGSGNFPTPEEKINFTKDEIFIKSERHFKSLSVRVAYFYKQQIIFREEKIVLSQLAAKGDLIELYIDKKD